MASTAGPDAKWGTCHHLRRRSATCCAPAPARRRMLAGEEVEPMTRPATPRPAHRARDGIRLRLADHGGGGRGAGRVRRPLRGRRRSRRTGCRTRCSPTAAGAAGRGLRVLIAGAGGAAHLPGMLAAVTPLPVIGVPVPLQHLDGMDSLLSIVQMPAGVPVATVAGRRARNAGLLAVRILAATNPALRRNDRLPGRASHRRPGQGQDGARRGRQAATDGVLGPAGGLPAPLRGALRVGDLGGALL